RLSHTANGNERAFQNYAVAEGAHELSFDGLEHQAQPTPRSPAPHACGWGLHFCPSAGAACPIWLRSSASLVPSLQLGRLQGEFAKMQGRGRSCCTATITNVGLAVTWWPNVLALVVGGRRLS